jgi:hypothetical protein
MEIVNSVDDGFCSALPLPASNFKPKESPGGVNVGGRLNGKIIGYSQKATFWIARMMTVTRRSA